MNPLLFEASKIIYLRPFGRKFLDIRIEKLPHLPVEIIVFTKEEDFPTAQATFFGTILINEEILKGPNYWKNYAIIHEYYHTKTPLQILWFVLAILFGALSVFNLLSVISFFLLYPEITLKISGRTEFVQLASPAVLVLVWLCPLFLFALISWFMETYADIKTIHHLGLLTYDKAEERIKKNREKFLLKNGRVKLWLLLSLNYLTHPPSRFVRRLYSRWK